MADQDKPEALDLVAAGRSFEITGLADGVAATITPRPTTIDGVQELVVTFTAETPTVPAQTTITWRQPIDHIHYKWNPSCGESRYLNVTNRCTNKFKTRGIGSAPVFCLHDISGTNTLTVASSDVQHAGEIGVSIGENGTFGCVVVLFGEPWDPITETSVILRLDTRRRSYHLGLADVAAWWDAMLGDPVDDAPDDARMPLYCTWYSQQRNLVLSDVSMRAKLARDIGINILLVDGGWGEYDAHPTEESHPELLALIREVHAEGGKIMLWSWPTRTTKRIKRILDIDTDEKVVIGPNTGKKRPDPRYPDVREYIIKAYEYLLRDCDADGFKIDFIAAAAQPADGEVADDRRDYKCISEATARLLDDLAARLKTIKPDVLLEYRQPYVGPAMLRSGNMFRAVDFANCVGDNRIRVIDIRLTSGKRPAHADPITWHPSEPVESAAAQLTHTLFAVPQVSVRYENLPADHMAMLRRWIAFWIKHRDVILDGELTPIEPQSGYPVVLSQTTDKLLAAFYGHTYAPLPANTPATLLLVNGTLADHVVLELAGDLGARKLTVHACTGEVVCEKQIVCGAGLIRIDVPASGTAVLEAV